MTNLFISDVNFLLFKMWTWPCLNILLHSSLKGRGKTCSLKRTLFFDAKMWTRTMLYHIKRTGNEEIRYIQNITLHKQFNSFPLTPNPLTKYLPQLISMNNRIKINAITSIVIWYEKVIYSNQDEIRKIATRTKRYMQYIFEVKSYRIGT